MGSQPGRTPHSGITGVFIQFLQDYGWIILLILALLGWGLFIAKYFNYI
jgi:hypothetical protein